MTKHIETCQARRTITAREDVTILEAALEEPTHVYSRARHGRDHYLVDHFEGLAQRHFNLTFKLVLDEPLVESINQPENQNASLLYSKHDLRWLRQVRHQSAAERRPASPHGPGPAHA